MKIPATNLYMESTINKTFPYNNHTYDIDGTGSASVIPVTGSRSAGFTLAIPTLTAMWLAGLGTLLSLL